MTWALRLCLLLIFVGAFNSCESKHEQKPNEFSLSGTRWESDMYFYHNNYIFETDSTGFEQRGQFAWSCPIDTIELGVSGDSILLGDDEPFVYTLTDSILSITRLANLHDDELTFSYKHQKDAEDRVCFVSTNKYAYGSEYLYFKRKVR